MRVGDYIVGVRANDERLAKALRAALRDLLIHGADPFANLSLWLAHEPDVPHVLYWRGREVLRTEDASRLQRVALSLLDCLLPVPAALPLWARAIVGARGAVLVPMEHAAVVDAAQKRVAAAGWQLMDEAQPLVDPTSRNLLLEVAARLPIDWGALSLTMPTAPSPTEVPILAIVDGASESFQSLSGARRLARHRSMISGGDAPTSRSALADLALLLDKVPTISAGVLDEAGLIGVLQKL